MADPTTAAAEVQAAENRRYQAMIDQDFEAIDTLVSSDLVYIRGSGVIDNKAGYDASVRGAKFSKVDLEGVKTRVFGDTVILYGKCIYYASVDGVERVTPSIFSNIWVHGPKGWQMVHWQSLPAPAPKS
jgi:hypothetical protein